MKRISPSTRFLEEGALYKVGNKTGMCRVVDYEDSSRIDFTDGSSVWAGSPSWYKNKVHRASPLFHLITWFKLVQ